MQSVPDLSVSQFVDVQGLHPRVRVLPNYTTDRWRRVFNFSGRIRARRQGRHIYSITRHQVYRLSEDLYNKIP